MTSPFVQWSRTFGNGTRRPSYLGATLGRNGFLSLQAHFSLACWWYLWTFFKSKTCCSAYGAINNFGAPQNGTTEIAVCRGTHDQHQQFCLMPSSAYSFSQLPWLGPWEEVSISCPRSPEAPGCCLLSSSSSTQCPEQGIPLISLDDQLRAERLKSVALANHNSKCENKAFISFVARWYDNRHGVWPF